MSPIINELDLQCAIRKVRRDRARERDLEIWTEFCSKQLYQSNTSPKKEQLKVRVSPCKTQTPIEEEKNIIWPPPLFLTNRRNNLLETVIYDSQDEIPTFIDNLPEIKEVVDLEPQLSSASTKSHKDISSERNLNRAQKLNLICSKITEVLNGMKSQLMNFQIPEETAEMIRFQKKSKEFCARFSRNHLYHFELQVKEIRALNLWEPYIEWDEYTQYLDKIINVYQILLQAFSMFQRHMSLIWGLGDTIIKLYALIKGTIELNRVCNPYQGTLDITKSLQELNQSCLFVKESLSEILENCSSDKAYLKSHTSSMKNLTLQSIGRRGGNAFSCHCHQKLDKKNFNVNSCYQFETTARSGASGDRYSMYRAKSANKDIKKSKSSLSKGKLLRNVPKIAGPNIDTIRKPTVPRDRNFINQNLINKTGTLHGKSATRNKNCDGACLNTKTQSDLTKNKIISVATTDTKLNETTKKSSNSRMKYRRADVDNPDTLVTQHRGSSSSSNIKVRDGTTSVVSAAGNYSDARADGVGGSVGGASCGVSPPPRLLADFPGGAGTAGRPTRASENSAEQPKKIENKSNFKLLYLSHSDVTVQPKSNSQPSIVRNTSHNKQDIDKNVSKTDKKHDNAKKHGDGQTKSIALNSEYPIKLKTPQATRDAFMDYRLNFIQHVMENPMYTSYNSERKPWEAVSRISDRLITDMLNNITQEMEMEDLLKHLVALELDIITK